MELYISILCQSIPQIKHVSTWRFDTGTSGSSLGVAGLATSWQLGDGFESTIYVFEKWCLFASPKLVNKHFLLICLYIFEHGL